MKSNTSFRAISGATLLTTFLLALTFTHSAGAQGGQKPDLRVTGIRTPGGLCIGNTNKIQAYVQNTQNIGISKPVTVILHIQFPNGGQGQYTTVIQTGIGPNSNQPAWFNNVSLPVNGTYSFKVIADPANNIIETVETNNTYSTNQSVTKPCGQPTPAPQTYTLTIKVFEHGTWQGGQGQWISGATVTLTKQYDSSFPAQTATTDSTGKVSFTVQGGLYSFKAEKSGCDQVPSTPAQAGSTGVYQMGTYNSTRYLSLDCIK
ncbi:MAG: CARDB domain-containing protein [Acidobacteriota bacterium]